MRILEAGHYYGAKGPTAWSSVGWKILESLKQPGDRTMLLVDNIHPISDVSEEEQELPNIEFSLNADYTVMESDVYLESQVILATLKRLPKKKRAKRGPNGKWFISGFSLTNEEEFPLCVLWDAGLTLKKRNLGFQEGINILPYFYEEEQIKLLRIIAKAIPAFRLRAVLYKLNGNFWELGDKSPI